MYNNYIFVCMVKCMAFELKMKWKSKINKRTKSNSNYHKTMLSCCGFNGFKQIYSLSKVVFTESQDEINLKNSIGYLTSPRKVFTVYDMDIQFTVSKANIAFSRCYCAIFNSKYFQSWHICIVLICLLTSTSGSSDWVVFWKEKVSQSRTE